MALCKYLNIKWLLDSLEDSYGPNWIPLRPLVDGVGESVIDLFKTENLLDDSDEKISDILSRLELKEHDLFQKISKTKTEKVFMESY